MSGLAPESVVTGAPVDLDHDHCDLVEQSTAMLWRTGVDGGAFTPAVRELLDRVPNPRLDKPFDTQGQCALVVRLVG